MKWNTTISNIYHLGLSYSLIQHRFKTKVYLIRGTKTGSMRSMFVIRCFRSSIEIRKRNLILIVYFWCKRYRIWALCIIFYIFFIFNVFFRGSNQSGCKNWLFSICSGRNNLVCDRLRYFLILRLLWLVIMWIISRPWT